MQLRVLQRVFYEVWRAHDRYDPDRACGPGYWASPASVLDHLRRQREGVVSLVAVREIAGEDGRDIAERVIELAYFRGRTGTPGGTARSRAGVRPGPGGGIGRSPARAGRWLAAAAVAGVAIGAGAVVVAQNVDNSPSAQTVRLGAFGSGHTPATAKVTGGDRMHLDATALPGPGAGKLYEVWLTDAGRTRTYAVGSLGADRVGTFTVAPELMKAYSAIEVSVQPLDKSTYSG